MSQSDFVNRGQALVASGQFQEAVKVCRLGLLGRPTTVDGRVVLGQALLALKRYDEVLAEMRVAIELDHTSVASLALKAEAMLRKGDQHAALESLAKARALAPDDPQVAALIAEAERANQMPATTPTSHPAVGFVNNTSTRNYPGHQVDEDGPEHTDNPTSVATKSAKMRAAAPPGKSVMVGKPVRDKTGTAELDADDAVELDDDDIGALSPPPSLRTPSPDEPPRGAVHRSAGPNGGAKRQPSARDSGVELDADDLIVEDEETPPPVDPRGRSAVRSAVGMMSGPLDQYPVGPPQGSLAQAIAGTPHVMQVTPVAATPISPQHVPTASPRSKTMMPQQLLPTMPPPQQAPSQRMPAVAPPMQQSQSMFAAQEPTAPIPPPPSQASYAAAALPTMALSAAQLRSADAVDAMFQPPPGQQMMPQPPSMQQQMQQMQQQQMQQRQQQMNPMQTQMQQPPPPPQQQQIAASIPWAQSTVIANGPNGVPGPSQQHSQQMPQQHSQQMPQQHSQQMQSQPHSQQMQSQQQHSVDPALAALAASVDASSSGQMSVAPSREPTNPEQRPMKTGMRRTRSPLRVVLWIVLGGAVIGGGVFAGFQIRAMRLGNQIDSARVRATALAKEDTFAGWAAARDGLAGIVQASNTPDNRAALARARAQIAFELGDGLADAKSAVDGLKGEGGLDGLLAIAYLALAEDDPKAAKISSEAALAAAPSDAGALYVAGRAQLLGGDATGSLAHLKAAADADPRALYAVGLAHAYGEANQWDEALAATDRALTASADNPAALIERAEIASRGGRVTPTSQMGTLLAQQLDKIVAEGGRPLGEQARGVSPEQVALADLALARVQLARGNPTDAASSVKAAVGLELDDQRVVEGIIGEMFEQGDLPHARLFAEKAIGHWPNSRIAHLELAQTLVAMDKPDDALATIAKSGEVTTLPLGLAVRGDAKRASSDVDGARNDYDAALKREPKLEAAMIGRVTLDLAAGKVDDARRTLEPRFTGKDAVASVETSTAFAAVLRATGDATQLHRAQLLLEGLTAGKLTPVVLRAKVELARVYRDSGDLRAARDAYGQAAAAGSIDARLDSGTLLIDDRDPKAGYDTLEELVKTLGDAVTPNVLIEAARAAMLVGDHAGAQAHLDAADKAKGVVRWQLDRERGRLAFRRGDIAGAAQAVTRALDSCGADTETFLLAADTVYADLAMSDDKTPPKQGDLASKVTALTADRLVGRAEGAIVTGILALGAGKTDDATNAYKHAADQLDTDKASSRRRARASYGFAILAYNAHNLPEAKSQLDIVIGQDPSMYSAYLYRADVLGEQKDKKGALADALQAVAYDPDLIDGWYFVGKYAHDLADKKTQDLAIAKLTAIAPDSPHLRELQQLH